MERLMGKGFRDGGYLCKGASGDWRLPFFVDMGMWGEAGKR